MFGPYTITYDERCEFERLKQADVEQGKRIAELIARVAELRDENAQLAKVAANALARETDARSACATAAGTAVTAIERIQQLQEVVDAAVSWSEAQPAACYLRDCRGCLLGNAEDVLSDRVKTYTEAVARRV